MVLYWDDRMDGGLAMATVRFQFPETRFFPSANTGYVSKDRAYSPAIYNPGD